MLSSNSDDMYMSLSTKWWIISNTSKRRFGNHPINQRRQELGKYHHLF